MKNLQNLFYSNWLQFSISQAWMIDLEIMSTLKHFEYFLFYLKTLFWPKLCWIFLRLTIANIGNRFLHNNIVCMTWSKSNSYFARFWQIMPDSRKNMHILARFLLESCKTTVFLPESLKIVNSLSKSSNISIFFAQDPTRWIDYCE